MIERFKRVIRRHWPRLRLRTILLLTFVFVAALPGFGALFLRVYENTLVRQTEAELVAQGAALAATAAVEWPAVYPLSATGDLAPEPPSIDLRMSRILPERPPPNSAAGIIDSGTATWAQHLQPILRRTTRTTLASILLLDQHGRILLGPLAEGTYDRLPEVRSALGGQPATTLRRNDGYRTHYPLEWLSRASDLRIHHARPIIVGGHVVGVLLLSRSPRALFVGLYEDRGKIMLGVATIFATLVLLSGLLSRGIVRPVEALGQATRAVASGGGLVPPVPTTAAIEIQALYRDFATMADAIDCRSRYLRDFAHAVSHEFKTPLAGVGGAVELLQDHPDMAASDRERFLANIGADADRLSHLVRRLLDLAQADMAEMVEGVATDLNEVIRCIVDAHNNDHLSVTLDVAPALPFVAAPRSVIEAALTALIENSRQAGAALIHIEALCQPDAVAVAVRDDGPGIPPGDRERIFEPFFTSRRTSGGTGLGLPIIRSLLRAHRGTILLDARQTVGAAFVLRLPITDPEAPAEDIARSL